MKYLTEFILTSIFSITFSMSNAQALIISPSDERNILNSLSSTCGDTWCEGDFAFDFQALDCSPDSSSSCHVDFVMTSSQTLNEIPTPTSKVTPVVRMRHSVSCEFTNIQSLSQIVKNKRTWELNESFYDALSLCIEALEKSLQP